MEKNWQFGRAHYTVTLSRKSYHPNSIENLKKKEYHLIVIEKLVLALIDNLGME